MKRIDDMSDEERRRLLEDILDAVRTGRVHGSSGEIGDDVISLLEQEGLLDAPVDWVEPEIEDEEP